MYLIWIILWWYWHIFVCFTIFWNLTYCKCWWRRDLLNKADILKNIMTKHLVMQHAQFEIDILNIVTLFEITTGVSVLSRSFCARRMRPSGFHTHSDITWSVVYNAVPEIRLAGSVSMECFLATNFQFTVRTRSDGVTETLRMSLTIFLCTVWIRNVRLFGVYDVRWPFLAEVHAAPLKCIVPSSV